MHTVFQLKITPTVKNNTSNLLSVVVIFIFVVENIVGLILELL